MNAFAPSKIGPKQIKAAARKALIAADASYHAWTDAQQEQFRASIDEAATSRVEAVLLNDLFDIACTPGNAGDIWRDQPTENLNILNWAKLLTTGIGEDMIFLNEYLDENTSLLDFNSLYDYDYSDHLFQEQEFRKEYGSNNNNNSSGSSNREYQGRDYYALRFSQWARLLINDHFYYATLYSLASYLIEEIEGRGDDLIQRLIPHDYVEGKDHGKPEKGGHLWDMRLKADGLEKQLDELKARWHDYLQQRWLALSQIFAQAAPAVYTTDIQEGYEQERELHRYFIFNNEAALKQVRWRHFLSDCERLAADFAKVSDMIELEVDSAEAWLKESHQDIINNFDHKLTQLRRRRREIIAQGAFDHLVGPDSEEPE